MKYFQFFWRDIILNRLNDGNEELRGKGFWCLILINFFVMVLPIFLSTKFILIILGIGLLQLLYVIPWCMKLTRKGQIAFKQGVTNAAVLTFLFNLGNILFSFFSGWSLLTYR